MLQSLIFIFSSISLCYCCFFVFFFNDTATTEIYTLSLHDALPIYLINQIIKDKPDDFMVISGDDPITLQMIAAGAEGLISVVANAYPAEYSKMVRLCLQGKFDTAKPIHHKFTNIISSMFAEGSPSGVKAYLSEMGLCQNTFRLPVWPVSDKHHQKIRELM